MTLIEMLKEETALQRSKMSKTLSDMINYQTYDPKDYLEGGDTTISKNLKEIRIRLNIRLFKAYFEEDQTLAREYIRKIIRHESLHALQWAWVAKKYGQNGIEKMCNYIKNRNYETSVLEKGAKMYEDEKNARLQNFAEDLKIFA